MNYFLLHKSVAIGTPMAMKFHDFVTIGLVYLIVTERLSSLLNPLSKKKFLDKLSWTYEFLANK